VKVAGYIRFTNSNTDVIAILHLYLFVNMEAISRIRTSLSKIRIISKNNDETG